MHHDLVPLPGYQGELSVLTAALQGATVRWRNELGEATEDQVVWQPFPGGHSIGTLILHMVEVEIWWVEHVAAGKELSPTEMEELMSDEIAQFEVRWPTPPRKPLSYFTDLQDRYRARTLETLKSLTADQIGRYEDRTFTARWVVNHLVCHESYHGGQAVLLKLLQTKAS